jgi:hypothetical protein
MLALWLMTALGHLRQIWYVRVMSGKGAISEMPVVRFCRLKASVDVIQAPKPKR